MPRPLGNDTITILKPTLITDAVDNTSYWDFSNPTEITVENCSVQPFLPADKLAYEETRERDYSRSIWVVYAPSTEDTRGILPHDRVRFLGEVYEVFGEVGAWRRFHAKPHHVQIMLQRREG